MTIPGLARRSRRLAALAAVGLMVAACGGESDESAEESDNGARDPVAVTYVEAAPRTVEDIERTLATVEAKWSARVAAEVAANVEAIHVEAGDRVEPGTLLATLDADDLEIEVTRAAANMRRIETTIANTESEVGRQRQLAERGHVSASALEAAEAELDALREELAAARSELRRAERNLERAEIRAPHQGTVAERLVGEGDYVSAGTVILEIPRADRLQVRMPIPEGHAERLELGMPVRLSTVNARTAVEAEVTQIHPDVSPENRTITVIAEIDNPGGWRPGSSVNAEIVMESREAVALAPTSVVRRQGGNVVYLAEDGSAREQPVTLGRRTRAWIEITEGVSAGDRVIVDGAGFMSDGTPIEARPDDGEPAGPGVAARDESRS